MGNCCSSESEGHRYHSGPASGDGGAPYQVPGLTRVTMRPTKADQARREQTWRSTGIISLRDQLDKALPPGLGSHAETARVLDATNNELADISGLSVLVNLQKLTLTKNRIATLPVDLLSALGQLKLLVLDHNQLATLPVQLGQLTKLEKLSVVSNQLTSLPAGCLPPSLHVLSVAQNQLTSLPSEQLPTELEELDASGNRIQVGGRAGGLHPPRSRQRHTQLSRVSAATARP